jgi:RsiW-degrading membrane proteinase PrsW (M82 family)
MMILFVSVLIASLVMAALPGVLYLAVLRWMGLERRQARFLLMSALAWGSAGGVALALLWTTFLELPFDQSDRLWVQAAFLAPLAEELAKAVYFVLLIRWRRIDTSLLGLMYGLAVGLGFAITENFAYFLRAYVNGGESAWVGAILARTFFSVAVHATATGLWGAAVGRSRSAENKWARLLLPYVGFAAALVVHIAWNLSLTIFQVSGAELPLAIGAGAVFVSITLTVLVSWFAIRDERLMITRELGLEAERGTLPEEHVVILASPLARLREAWLQEGIDRREYKRTAMMLALRLRQYRSAKGAERGELERRVTELRKEMQASFPTRSSFPDLSSS